MVTPRFAAECLKCEEIAHDVFELHFTKPEGFTFIPGQFLLWDMPLVGNPSDIQPRSYSIASTPAEPELRFAVKYVTDGRTSEWMRQVAKPGVTLSMQGPLGRFALKEGTKDIFMVGTGTGIAPFRGMLQHALEQGEQRRIDLVFGVMSEADLFWTADFEALSHSFGNVNLHYALSKPTPEWKGHVGRVQTLVPLIAGDFSKKQMYICGSPNMTNDLKKLCLEEWGFSREEIHVEGYV